MGLNDAGRVKVIIRYRDGKVLRGYTDDFSPSKPAFHFQPGEQVGLPIGQAKPTVVRLNEMKAVFFVKDFSGDPSYSERRQFVELDRPTGRKVEVTFQDGEVIVGTNMGYDPKRIGFFVVPVDTRANNLRVFVVTEAVKQFRYL